MKSFKLWVPEANRIEYLPFEFTGFIENPNELILRTRYTHLSAGTELACLAGLESFFKIPATPGYTAIAEVLEKGANVPFEIGQLVYTYGPHCSHFKIDITDRWHGVCVALPEGSNEAEASFTHMANIALTAIRNSKIELGDLVAVSGLGAIGILAAQLAQLQGARVIGTEIEENRLMIAKKCGLEMLVNSKLQDPVKAILEFTHGKGVSTLIDASGSARVIEQTLDGVAHYGEVILLGTPRSPYETNLTKTLQHFHLFPHCHTLKGALEFIYPTQPMEFVKHSIERNAGIILKLIQDKKLKIGPIHSHTLHPSKAAEAYAGLRDKKDEYIGVVFDWIS
jgi:2-desacetyl-2-hydroxyethyl bacteriochlorophyllide A dehydrogenase